MCRSLQADRSIPVSDVELNPLKLARQEHTVVRNKVAYFFQLIHSLLQPMLGRNDIFEKRPLLDND
jgi:hypothetical protein